MAAVIDAYAFDLEAAGHSAHRRSTIEHDDLMAGQRGAPRRHESGGAGTHDRNVS